MTFAIGEDKLKQKWWKALAVWTEDTKALCIEIEEFLQSCDPPCKCGKGIGRLATHRFYAVNVRVCDYCQRMWNPDL